MTRIPTALRGWVAAGGLAAAVVAASGNAKASTFEVLHVFTGAPSDGNGPSSNLLEDAAGNLYGETNSGGSGCPQYGGCGSVFEVAPDGTETVLYNFCTKTNCADGSFPMGNLAEDGAGNLYGTTTGGGANDAGAVFKVSPGGQETVLYSFCSVANCSDGASPHGGVILDQSGNLYGTTFYGGLQNCGCGTAFKVTPAGTESVLYSFCSQANCADGESPLAGLTMDQGGNLYGTTEYGGNVGTGVCSNYGCGTVFAITTAGVEKVLHAFCNPKNCSDGNAPWAGVLLGSSGNLYGTTVSGGSGQYCDLTYGCGVVFQLTPNGAESVIYSFCNEGNCVDGMDPFAGLSADKKGNLYGTTFYGGENRLSAGTMFKVTDRGAERALTSFGNRIHGSFPQSPVTIDAAGYIYGTTGDGGDKKCDCGLVFRRHQ